MDANSPLILSPVCSQIDPNSTFTSAKLPEETILTPFDFKKYSKIQT